MVVCTKWSWTVLVVGLFAGRCLAQEAAVPAVAPGFGPALPLIVPGVSQTDFGLDLNETYSSNVTGGSAEFAARRHLTPADFLTNPYGSLAIARPLGVYTVYLSGEIGYIDYAKNPILSRSNIQLQTGGNAQFGSCQTSVTGGYRRGTVDLADVALAETTGALAAGKDVVQDAALAFTASCGQAVGLAPTVSAAAIVIHNGFGGLAVENVNEFTSSGGLAYRSASAGILSAVAEYNRVDYPGRSVVTLSGTLPERTETLGGGLTYSTSKYSRLQGSASLIYVEFQPYSSESAGYHGITYDVTANYVIGSAITASASAGRQVTPSNNPTALFDLLQTYDLSLVYTLGATTTLGLDLTRFDYHYEGLVVPQMITATRETRDKVIVTAGRALGRRLKVELSVGYQRQDANFPGLSYPQATVALAVTSKF